MAKATKKQQNWFSALKGILFLGVAYVFWMQLNKAGIQSLSFEPDSSFAFLVSLLLVPLNWWLEYKKWTFTLNIAEVTPPETVRRQSFLAGIVTGMLTPNMLGNFLGRIYYFQRRDRISITIHTLFSNYAQFIASMFFGLVAFIFLHETPFGFLPVNWIVLGGFGFIVLLMSFFYFDWFFKLLFPSRMRLYSRFKGVRERNSFRIGILLLSVVRHSVFTLQFGFMLLAYGADIGWTEVFWIWQYYFWVTLTPSLFFGKFLIRDSVALWVLGAVLSDQQAIVVSSLMIWCLNLLVPTLVALFFVRQNTKLT